MRTTIGLFCLGAAVLLSGSLATADAQTRGNAGARERGSNVDVGVGVVFSSGELSTIRAWFGDSHNLQGLPPGLAGRETLPPGLERQLRRNGTLPPGLDKKIHRVPVDLDRRLPDLRPGVSRVIIGGRIVLVDDASSMILDIAAIF
jgi:hypothetical protein